MNFFPALLRPTTLTFGPSRSTPRLTFGRRLSFTAAGGILIAVRRTNPRSARPAMIKSRFWREHYRLLAASGTVTAPSR
jgi:hypothetical protein